MLGQHADPDQPRGYAPEGLHAREGAKDPRASGLSALEQGREQPALHEPLEALSQDRRKPAAPRDPGEVALPQAAGAQWLGQQVGRGHRVLDREVDPHPADWRHGVGGVADAQQARPVPPPQPIDLDRERLDVVPAPWLPLRAIGEARDELAHRRAQGVDAAGPQPRVAALGDDVADLPVATPVDHRHKAPGAHTPDALGGVRRRSREAEPQHVHRHSVLNRLQPGEPAHVGVAPVGGHCESRRNIVQPFPVAVPHSRDTSPLPP